MVAKNLKPKSSETQVESAFRACLGSLALVVVFSFCVNLLFLALPLYMLQLYDRVMASRSVDTLVMLTLIVVIALLVHSLLDALRREMLSRVGSWLEDQLEGRVLRAAFQVVLRSN